jgi:protein-glutamine gamma-glutamyltransferase
MRHERLEAARSAKAQTDGVPIWESRQGTLAGLRRALPSLGEGLFSRRRRDAFLMAALAWIAVMRVPGDNRGMVVVYAEIAVIVALFVAGWLVDRYGDSLVFSRFRGGPDGSSGTGRLVGRLIGTSALAVPLASRCLLGNRFGEPAAWEIVMMTTLAVGAVTLAFCGVAPKTTALSVVCSGFLMLFTTSISDRTDAIYVAVVWVLVCMGWMLANHWERLEVHLAQSVRRHRGVRFGMMAGGLVVCGAAALASWGRGPAARLLQNGVMPTSGGNQWTDPSARSGVGSGDAVVAAKEHAASFGAVESEIFLQSHQPSLFDLFDDVLGKPERMRRSEKAIGMPNVMRQKNQPKPSQSQQGSATFSTSRQSTKPQPKMADGTSAALLQWIGPPATGLALERFDTFDGVDWTASWPTDETATNGRRSLLRQDIDGKPWFFRSAFLSATTAQGELFGPVRADAVKVIRLRSPRIAAPAMAVGVHIADIDREDFFDVTGDGSFFMPDRLMVPALTVVRLVTQEIDGDAVRAISAFPKAATKADEGDQAVTTDGIAMARSLAVQWTDGAKSDWERVDSVVSKLRQDFVFDRETAIAGEDPLADFLKTRRGGDHLFATAATVMLRHLGFDSRLVTGFYAPRRSGWWGVGGGEQIDVLPHDAHVWAEVQVADDLWLPVEPTPGYEPPRMHRTLTNRIAAMFWAAAPAGLVVCCVAVVGWVSRRIWGEWVCRVLWLLSTPLSGRRRVAVLVRLLEWRGLLAGLKRPAGVTPRNWVADAAGSVDDGSGELSVAAERFFDAADAAFYRPGAVLARTWSADAERVASGITVSALIRSKRAKVVSA